MTEQIGTVLHTSLDEELLPFLTERDGVCSKCKKNGQVSNTCPNPQIAGIPDEFLKAFPKSKEAYEAAVATGHYNKVLVDKWDYCLMAYMKAERKLESATPTAVIPPADPNKDEPREPQPKTVTRKTGPVGLAKLKIVKLIPEPEVITLSPPKEAHVAPPRVVRVSKPHGRGEDCPA